MRPVRSTIALIGVVALLCQSAPLMVGGQAADSSDDVLVCHETGTICPMHRPHKSSDGPALREDCGNPDPAMFAPIVTGVAIVPTRFVLRVDAPPGTRMLEASGSLQFNPATLDTPPPRA